LYHKTGYKATKLICQTPRQFDKEFAAFAFLLNEKSGLNPLYNL
jgi:hypothetical protein